MRIVHVVESLARAGAEMQVVDVACELARLGHTVAVVTLASGGPLEPKLRAAGIELAPLEMRGRWEGPIGYARYLQFVRQWSPDIVHGHMLKSILMTRLGHFAAPRARYFETSHTPYEREEVRYWIYRATSGLGGEWSSVCDEGLDVHLAKRAVTRGTVRRNGIRTADYRRDLAARDRLRAELDLGGRFTWLAAGSFRDEMKDFGTLLRAFASKCTSGEGDHLLIAGTGPLLDGKKRLADELGIAPRVQFLGARGDMPALFSAADGFVLSSSTESGPLVLLEAAAAELPLVTTDVGYAPIVVDGPDYGRLVPKRQPGSLARAMESIEVLSTGERAAMGRRLRARVEADFAIEAVAKRWEHDYQEALARR